MEAPMSATRTAKVTRAATLDEQLERKLAAVRKHRGSIRYFHRHRSLLASGEHQARAKTALAHAQQRVRRLTTTIAVLRAKIHKRDARRLDALPPRAAICQVFRANCKAAVAVAWCESRLRPTAQNGQYLGVFQMGSYARQLFGHGPTAHAQAVAARRYFVRSGGDWSPWSCRWAAS
jgi:hypothetical protein